MDLLTLMMLYATSPVAAAALPRGAHSHQGQGFEKAVIRTISPEADPWQAHIAEAAERFDLPAEWIRAVMQAESSGRTMLRGRPITSPAGALGLMQVMPDTYAKMRDEHRLGPDPHDPRDNILAGAAYLRAMYDRFGWPGLFAAYNAGPARFEAHLREEQPLPPETRKYMTTLGVDLEEAVSVASALLQKQVVPKAKPEPPAPRPDMVVMGEAEPFEDEPEEFAAPVTQLVHNAAAAAPLPTAQ